MAAAPKRPSSEENINQQALGEKRMEALVQYQWSYLLGRQLQRTCFVVRYQD